MNTPLAKFPDASWGSQICGRLRSGDPTAPAELVERCLEPLSTCLRKVFPQVHDRAVLDDAAADALLAFAKHPEKYDYTQRALRGYLEMAAKGDVKNALAKQRRLSSKLRLVENVELVVSAGNKKGALRSSHDSRSPDSRLRETELRASVETIMPDPGDRKLVELILEGERSTAVFAQVLGVENLPRRQREHIVKKHKDRIKQRLRRLGEQLGEC